MKILPSKQLKEADLYTIREEPITSLELMERASRAFVHWFVQRFPRTDLPLLIFAGAGNNGGDGLAIARLLHAAFYEVSVFLCQTAPSYSADCKENLNRLPAHGAIEVHTIATNSPFPVLPQEGILIDALWGTGLNRPLGGYWAELVIHLSDFKGIKVAVDIPSGMCADAPSEEPFFRADFTCTFELPKLAFFFPENASGCGHWDIVKIGLHPDFLESVSTIHYYNTRSEVMPLRKVRNRFGHKGQYGHGMLICGNKGMAGAAILAARACLRSGVGLLTVHSAAENRIPIQCAVPEAMFDADSNPACWSETPLIPRINAIGVGSGIGQAEETIRALEALLHTVVVPLVIDADALNIIASQHWQNAIPKGSILTPHPGEFERLFGKTRHSFERLELLRAKAMALHAVILLKGAFTIVALPDGTCHFNSTGNPGMATAGSGDVLTGILTALLAQGYSPEEAAILGVWVHGMAGDLAVHLCGEEGLVASDIIEHIGNAFIQLR